MFFIRNKLIFKSDFFRDTLVSSIFQSGVFIMKICFNCENSGSADKCKIDKMSVRYAEDARKNLVDYNLTFLFHPNGFVFGKNEIKKFEKLKKYVKFNRLQREFDILEKKNWLKPKSRIYPNRKLKNNLPNKMGLNLYFFCLTWFLKILFLKIPIDLLLILVELSQKN